jgi:hypothetical protein
MRARSCKAGKPNEFGKMVKLQEAENQIVIDYEAYDRRPSDTEVLIPAIECWWIAEGGWSIKLRSCATSPKLNGALWR